MGVPVLTAVSDARWEARLVAALAQGDLGVSVVRRCVDLADLLATAATGSASAALLSADLRRLDREALGRLALAGVAVVGLVAPGEEEAERRLRQLGVLHVLPSDSTPEELSAAVLQAVSATAPPSPGERAALGEPRRALPDPVVPEQVDAPHSGPGTGRLVAVWGPAGAPGRTTLAVGLASELAQLGRSALLVDADVYGGVIAQVLGLLDEAPGLAAACRLANNGALDLPALAGLARAVGPELRVLSGIARADRWPELRPAALEVVLELARSLADTTVVDCGFCLEQDEELAYDTAAPRRNGATLAALETADTVVAVGSADPVGLQRLVRGLAELRDAVPGVQPLIVVNRLRAGAVPGDAEREVRAALSRYAGVEQLTVVPSDVVGLDRALAAGRTLAEAASTSPARAAITALAAQLAGISTPAPQRRRLLSRR
ncbi:MAG: chromosome partitioning protein [Frankiales bacterium]|nr:MAG: chromosome partitioning protein [Frankiales bacterium]